MDLLDVQSGRTSGKLDAGTAGDGGARDAGEPSPSAPSTSGAFNCDLPPPDAGELRLQLTRITDDLTQPTYVAAAPGDDARLFVLERTGRIRVMEDGELLPEPFLDLSENVITTNESGLIGLAFHPQYAKNGRFYVQYAAAGSNGTHPVVLSEVVRSRNDPTRADPESERILMTVEYPSDLHLGGMLAFGPQDQMLYIARGDGGSGRSQELGTFLGKMLRIDVDAKGADRAYGVPAGNMAAAGALPEIWSRGLRNPWRFSFDPCTADMYIGDVGEGQLEEINHEPANTPGRNYGWNTLEGSRCFEPAEGCDQTGMTLPVAEYEHVDFGCAVISGYVYRGERIPALRGTYLYADYCSGGFGSLRMEGGRVAASASITSAINPDRISTISSFGMDNAGELYVVTLTGGLYRIEPSEG